MKIGQGAALMTETTLDVRIVSSEMNIVANNALAKGAQRNLEEVGGFRYTPEEKHFADELQKSLPADAPGTGFDLCRSAPASFRSERARGIHRRWRCQLECADDRLRGATFVPGVVPHTWQATACAGMSTGQKGMVVAARAIAITGADLFLDPTLIGEAHLEFQRQLQGKSYQSHIPADAKPPLDYRKE